MSRTAADVHKSFAGNLTYEDKILWDAYAPRQFPLFRQKINELFREPPPENKCTDLSPANGVRGKPELPPPPSKAMEKIRQAVYNSTIAQSKYTNKNLLATFILVTVAEGTTHHQAQYATKFSIHLLVRTRKCMNDDDSTNCCMVFIDEQGNVYKNWTHFMETNVLPEGIALAPPNGVYRTENDSFQLDSWLTPASSAVAKAAGIADVAAGVGGFAAAGGTLAALALPVIVPALPVLGAVCAVSGAYSSIRSGWSLWSRKDHEQSIALTDSSARGSWLGVASGALAVSSSIANKSLATLAMAGKEVTTAREFVVNGMNISTMLLSGTGVANGVLDLLLKHFDDEEISAIDVLQVAASLAIFTHSAYNFRLASTIVAQSQDTKMNAYRSELSNRQRKMFDKMAKETLRTNGASKGKIDLIRLINEVPDKQYLNDLHKINKNLNEKGVRFSAGTNGQILLNDEIQVNSGDLRSSVQHGIGDNILGKISKPIPDPHQTIPNQQAVNNLTNIAFSENTNHLINYVQTALKIASPLIANAETFQDCLRNIIINVGENVAKFLIEKAKEFIKSYGRDVELFIKTALHLEVVLWDLYKKCEENLLSITVENIEERVQWIYEQLLSFYESLSFENAVSKKIQCDFCKGFYQIVQIN